MTLPGRDHARPGRQAGFTLLEMLIVLALLGLLIAALAGAIYLGITARAKITATANDQADFAAFQRILNNQLRLAYPDWISVGQYRAIDFSGRASELQFLGPAPMSQGEGFSEYILCLSGSGKDKRLMLRSSMPTNLSQPLLTTFFATDLAGVRFAYFGSAGDGASPSWQDAWLIRSTPPELIAITVSFTKADPRNWPILIVHPDIDADITCTVDATTHRCQGR